MSCCPGARSAGCQPHRSRAKASSNPKRTNLVARRWPRLIRTHRLEQVLLPPAMLQPRAALRQQQLVAVHNPGALPRLEAPPARSLVRRVPPLVAHLPVAPHHRRRPSRLRRQADPPRRSRLRWRADRPRPSRLRRHRRNQRLRAEARRPRCHPERRLRSRVADLRQPEAEMGQRQHQRKRLYLLLRP